MKIEITKVNKWLLTELDAHKPISVIVENYRPGQGKIIIEYYGHVWSCYWSAMGSMSVEKFFQCAHIDYLVKKLDPELLFTVVDKDTVLETAKNHVANRKRHGKINDYEEAYFVRMIDTWINHDIDENKEILHEIFGKDWQDYLPKKPNHDYVFLCKIITIVKEAFRNNKL